MKTLLTLLVVMAVTGCNTEPTYTFTESHLITFYESAYLNGQLNVATNKTYQEIVATRKIDSMIFFNKIKPWKNK